MRSLNGEGTRAVVYQGLLGLRNYRNPLDDMKLASRATGMKENNEIFTYNAILDSVDSTREMLECCFWCSQFDNPGVKAKRERECQNEPGCLCIIMVAGGKANKSWTRSDAVTEFKGRENWQQQRGDFFLCVLPVGSGCPGEICRRALTARPSWSFVLGRSFRF